MRKFSFAYLLLIGTFGLHPMCAAAEPSRVSPLPVEEIAAGVFFAEGQISLPTPGNLGAISNVGFIVGGNSVAVIDTGGSFAVGLRLRAAIRANTNLPIRYVINTHMHPDHIFGNVAFRDSNAAFVAHHKLPRALAARTTHYLNAYRTYIGDGGFAGTEVVMPTQLVSAPVELDLGDRIIRLTPYPTAHTDNDMTVFDVTTRTLFTGDLLFVRHLPVLDGNLNGWLAATEELAKVDAAIAAPGHGALQKSWPGALESQRRYLTALRDDVRAAIKSGRSLRDASDSIKPNTSGNWSLIEDYHRRNVTTGYAEMEWE